jgi:hypothetical protein
MPEVEIMGRTINTTIDTATYPTNAQHIEAEPGDGTRYDILLINQRGGMGWCGHV